MMATAWNCTRLSNGPYVETSNFVLINDHEIAVALFANGEKNHGIHIYNVISNKWQLHIKYPHENIQNHSICHNPNTKSSWLHGDDSELMNTTVSAYTFQSVFLQC